MENVKNADRSFRTGQIGDLVLSYNEKTGEIEYKPVTQLFRNEVKTIFKLTYANGKIVETTWNHPFLVTDGLNHQSKAVWKEAKDIRPGDRSVLADGSCASTHLRFAQQPRCSMEIVSVEQEYRDELVYNFEVEDNHTYFVTENAVLVHNYEKNIDFST
ncbi:MAG: hypothetical protein KDK45_15030, partial [Leptospiraceae bacterium]|nr:hypothetical protein [Leptospiraceae bacterium]